MITGTQLRMPNSFDPDQDRHNVGPGLDPNSLQRLTADNNPGTTTVTLPLNSFSALHRT